MALRADTARHIITGATVLIFSAAAIGTAMRYQGRGPITPMSESAELPAIDTGAQTVAESAPPQRFVDRPGGTGGDMGVRLDGVSALNVPVLEAVEYTRKALAIMDGVLKTTTVRP